MQVYGKKKAMKDSQTYPMEFCEHMFNEWKGRDASNVKLLAREELASSSESEGYVSDPSDWEDCEPVVVIAELTEIWSQQGPGAKLHF